MIPLEDLKLIAPYMEMYNHIMTCKNLGISVGAETLTPDDLDFLSLIYNETEKAHESKRKRKR